MLKENLPEQKALILCNPAVLEVYFNRTLAVGRKKTEKANRAFIYFTSLAISVNFSTVYKTQSSSKGGSSILTI